MLNFLNSVFQILVRASNKDVVIATYEMVTFHFFVVHTRPVVMFTLVAGINQ